MPDSLSHELRLVGGPIAEEPADRRSEHKAGALDPCGRERESHGVEVCVCDHREPQGVGHTVLVRLAVPREREHRLDQPFELQSGPHLTHETCSSVAVVPELVRRAGRNEDAVTWSGWQFLAIHLERDRALDDLEELLLKRVEVRRRHESRGLDEALESHILAACLGGRRREDEALAGNGILDRVA